MRIDQKALSPTTQLLGPKLGVSTILCQEPQLPLARDEQGTVVDLVVILGTTAGRSCREAGHLSVRRLRSLSRNPSPCSKVIVIGISTASKIRSWRPPTIEAPRHLARPPPTPYHAPSRRACSCLPRASWCRRAPTLARCSIG